MEITINKNTMLWAIIGLLFITALFMSFKAGSVDASTIKTTATAVKSTASSGMVGGC